MNKKSYNYKLCFSLLPQNGRQFLVTNPCSPRTNAAYRKMEYQVEAEAGSRAKRMSTNQSDFFGTASRFSNT